MKFLQRWYQLMNPFWKIRNHIQFDQKTKGEVWHPEIEFENVLNYQKTEAYGGDTTFSFWLDIDYSKYYNMVYGEKFQITFSCHFHLDKYPFDSHECQMITNIIHLNCNSILWPSSTTWIKLVKKMTLSLLTTHLSHGNLNWNLWQLRKNIIIITYPKQECI